MAKLTSAGSRAGRGLLKWSVRDLAEAAGVSPNTVFLIESDRPYREETAEKIKDAFARAGVEILNGDAPGARMRGGG